MKERRRTLLIRENETDDVSFYSCVEPVTFMLWSEGLDKEKIEEDNGTFCKVLLSTVTGCSKVFRGP